MKLDVRLPIGLMFSFLGLILVACGLFMDRAIYSRSLGININLWWGAVLLAFGLVMLFLGRRRRHIVEPSPEGQAIEQREHATGLEVETVR
jgi:hypothetical protein